MKMYFLLANLGICSSGGVGGLGLSGPLVLPCSRAGLLSSAWPREGELCPGLCPAEPWPQGSSAPQRSALLCRLCCGKQAEGSLSAGWHRHSAHYMAGGRDWQSFFFFFLPLTSLLAFPMLWFLYAVLNPAKYSSPAMLCGQVFLSMVSPHIGAWSLSS